MNKWLAFDKTAPGKKTYPGWNAAFTRDNKILLV